MLNLIIAGDFNRSKADAFQLANHLNLWLYQKNSDILITLLNARKPENNNQLDFILGNTPFHSTKTS